MEITRYNEPAQSDFVNTYSPIPFNEMMQAGAMKAKQYEQGLDTLMKTYEDTHNLKYIPQSKDEEYIKNEVIPATKQIVDKYANQDLSDISVIRQMRQDFSSNIDANRIRGTQDSYVNWNKREQLKQGMFASGHRPFMDTPDTGYDTSIQGVYSKKIEPITQWRERAENVFNNLEGDSRTLPNGQVVKVIDPAKIRQTAYGNVQSFLDTTEGQQMVESFKSMNPKTKKSNKDIAYEYLLEVGKEKLQTDYEGSLPERKAEKEEESLIRGVEGLAGESVNTDRLNPEDFNIKQAKTRELPSYSPMGVTLLEGAKPRTYQYYDRKMLVKPEVQQVVRILPKEFKEAYNKSLAVDKPTVDSEEYKQAQAKIFGKLKEIYSNVNEHLLKGSYVVAWTPKKRKDETMQLLDTDKLSEVGAGLLPNRKYYDMDSHKSYSNAKDFYKDVIVPEVKDNENARVSIIGNLHPDNPFSHPSLTNDPDFRKGSVMTFGSKTVIVSGSSSTNPEKLANETYNNMKYLPNTELEEEILPGVTEIYDGNTYTFKHNGQVVSTSPDFDEAYYKTVDYLKSNK